MEFNDQGNSCSGDEVQRIELFPDRLVVTFVPEGDMVAGRVSYTADADMYSGPAFFDEYPLGSIVVRLKASHKELADLRQALTGVAAFGCQFLSSGIGP